MKTFLFVFLGSFGSISWVVGQGHANLSNQDFELVIPSGHTDLVNILRTSSRGDILLSASRDPTIIKVWDFHSGRELRTLKGPRSPITELIMIGDSVISVDASGFVFCWNAKNGSPLNSFDTKVGHIKRASIVNKRSLWMLSATGSIVCFSLDGKKLFEERLGVLVGASTIDPDGTFLFSVPYSNEFLSYNINVKALEHIPMPDSIAENINTLFYSSHHKATVIGVENGIYRLSKDHKIEKLIHLEGTPLSIATSGELLVVGLQEKKFVIANLVTGKKVSRTDYKFPVYHVMINPHDQSIITTSQGVDHGDQRIRLFNGETFDPINRFETNVSKTAGTFYDAADNTLYVASYNNNIIEFNIAKNHYRLLRGHSSWIENLSGAGNYLISQTRNLKEIFIWRDGEIISRGMADSLNLLITDHDFIAWSNLNRSYTFDGRSLSRLKDPLPFHLPVKSISPADESLRWIPRNIASIVDGNMPEKKEFKKIKTTSTLIAQQIRSDSLRILSHDGRFIRGLKEPLMLEFAIHEDSTIAISRKFGSVRILSLRDKTDYSVDLPTSEVSAINFMHPKPFVLASTLEGFVAIIEPKKKYQLFLLPMNEDGYVVYNPKSFDFDGTEQAFNKIYLTRGYEFIDFSQLKERYYKPNLLGRFISNNYQESDALPKITEKEMYPKVACKESGSNTHFVTVTNQGGGIGKVSLLLNGLEIKDDIRPKGLSQHSHTFQYRIDWTTFKNLKTGVNCLKIVAWNGSNWLHSPPIRICKHHNTKGATAEVGDQKTARPNPNIYILSVGVADYEGEKIDLKYSAKDAESMSQALQLGATKLFGAEKAFVYTLTDNSERKPSKANIEKTFKEIAAKSSPHDILIVYLSGHGINWGGDNGDFYYLTSDAYSTELQAYNDPAIRTNATISSKELIELFKTVPSDKRVLMIDACASGKMVQNLVASRDVSSSTLRALDRLRDRTGFHIITGCAADAVSYEASRFGQGVLTYSLIEGIKGASLREEKFVDVNQLFQYAKERVPTLAKGIGGIQSPQVFSPQGAQSFDIGELDDELKRKIPLPKTRPLYVRSQLIDETKFRDVLGLSRLLDEALNETSAKGESAPLLFVDVAEYPEGCQVSGLYRQTPTGISVKLNKTCDGKEQTYTQEAANSQALTAAILAWLSQSQ